MMPADRPAVTPVGRRRGPAPPGHARQLAARKDPHLRAHLGAARSHAAPEHAPARRVSLTTKFLHPLHREGQRQVGLSNGVWGSCPGSQQAVAFIAAPAGPGVDHVPALEGRPTPAPWRDLDGGLPRELQQRGADVGKRQGRVGHGVELVDCEHQQHRPAPRRRQGRRR